MPDYSVKDFLRTAVAIGALTPDKVKQCIGAYHAAQGKRAFQAILAEEGGLTTADMKRVVAALKGTATSEGTEVIKKAVATLRDDTGGESGSEILRPSSSSKLRRDRLEKSRSATEPATPAEKPKPRRSFVPWVAVGVVAAACVVGAYFFATRGSTNPPKAAANADEDKPAETKKPSDPVGYDIGGGLMLTRLNTGTPVAADWNQLAHEIWQQPGREMTQRHFLRARDLLKAARDTPDEPLIRDNYDRMLSTLKGKAKTEFDFYKKESAKLCERKRFGDAWDSWEWFPNAVDNTGVFTAQIPEEQAAIVEQARAHFADLKARVADFEAGAKFEEAKLLLLESLLMGEVEPLKPLLAEARKRLDELSRNEEKAIHEAELGRMKEFDRREKERLEAATRAEEKRSRVWDFVRQRNVEGARTVLRTEILKEASNPPVLERLKAMEAILAAVEQMYVAAEKTLAAKSGETRKLAFATRTLEGKIRSAAKGRVEMTVDRRDVSERTVDLAFSELPALVPDPRLKGLAMLLAEDADGALAEFEKAGDAALSAFVRQSPAVLEKSADDMMNVAAGLMEKGEYEKAAELYSTLSLVPAKKLDAILKRAECYFNQSLFPAAMLDLEQVFAGGKPPRAAIELLNNTYERAALIEKAVELYEAALKADPKNDKVAEALLRLYVKTHRYDDADKLVGSLTREARFNPHFNQILQIMQHSRGAFKGKSPNVAPFGRYIVETNAGQELAQKWAQDMDAIYREYLKVFPYSKNETLRFYVKIFEKEYDFRTYFGGNEVGKTFRIEGFYQDVGKELVLYKCDGMYETMRHEGFHQYLDYYVNDCPIWFNEGYASFFETSTADKPVYNETRAKSAREALSANLVPGLKEMLLMSARDWQGHTYAAHLYGESWSFIYFLTKTGRRKILDQYFMELMRGKSQKAAFDAVFKPMDLPALEKEWREAVLKDTLRP